MWTQAELRAVVAHWTPPRHCHVYLDVHRRHAVITLYHRYGCTAYRRWPRNRPVEHVTTILDLLGHEMAIKHRECQYPLSMRLAMERRLEAVGDRFEAQIAKRRWAMDGWTDAAIKACGFKRKG